MNKNRIEGNGTWTSCLGITKTITTSSAHTGESKNQTIEIVVMPPLGDGPPAPSEIECDSRLGGLLRHYYRKVGVRSCPREIGRYTLKIGVRTGFLNPLLRIFPLQQKKSWHLFRPALPFLKEASPSPFHF